LGLIELDFFLFIFFFKEKASLWFFPQETFNSQIRFDVIYNMLINMPKPALFHGKQKTPPIHWTPVPEQLCSQLTGCTPQICTLSQTR